MRSFPVSLWAMMNAFLSDLWFFLRMIISLGSESGQPVAFVNASYAKTFTVPWLGAELAISEGLVRLAADEDTFLRGWAEK